MKFRLFCFGSHLFISLLIAVLSLYLVFECWYPNPLDKALGVASIFLLLLCIDIIVGPLLTLVVAKKDKKTLKTDLLTIGIIQVFALVYGLYIVTQGRPVWIIYDSGRFELVQAYEAVIQSEERPSPSAFRLGLAGPVWGNVTDQLPDSIQAGDAYYRAEFLESYDENVAAKVGAYSLPLSVLNRFNDPNKVNEILKRHPEADSFVPMAAKNKALVVLVNKEIGRPIEIVDLSPW